MKTKVVVNGAKGKMGSEVVKAIGNAKDLDLVGKLDIGDPLEERLREFKPDVMVDFTHPSSVRVNICTAIKESVNVVVGTTGLRNEDLEQIEILARQNDVGVLLAPNFCIGAVLMMRFAKEAAKFMPDVEIIELHHPGKADAPSGTAKLTAEKIAEAGQRKSVSPKLSDEMMIFRGGQVKDVHVHSVRLPGLVAHQEVIFGGEGQILTIRHDSLNRESFMPGVLLGVRSVRNWKGLVCGLDHILFDGGK